MKQEEIDEIDYWKNIAEFFDERTVQYLQTESKLKIDLDKATNYYQKLMSLKSYYNSNKEELLKTCRQSKNSWFISYPTDWYELFTDIEFQAWCAIRTKGRIILYPQFPVENYFIDFANPGLKIGLELDGKDFHDKEKDRQRDLNLKNKGWTIYRITGKEMCRTNYKTLDELDYYDTSEQELFETLSYWLLETGDGVIQAIKEIYFEDNSDVEYENEDWNNLQNMYKRLCRRTLDEHISL